MRSALACLTVTACLLVGCDDKSKNTSAASGVPEAGQSQPTGANGHTGVGGTSGTATSGGHPPTTNPDAGSPGGGSAGSSGGDSSGSRP